jgi:pimeloyl-ACP methyl ester carboxylesterase
MGHFHTGTVISADGTVIGYRQVGQGPSVILLHGAMLAAQDMMKLAGALSADFTVYVPDRRGRGSSGPYGEDHGIQREVEDLRALVAATGASRVFGLSAGALVALRTALATNELQRVAVYEPPLSVDGSVPLAWVPRYTRELDAGRTAAALVTILKGLGTEPLFQWTPRLVLVPLLTLGARLQRSAQAGDVPVSALVPTMRYDLRLIREMADTAKDYAALQARVLLLGGAKSPAYLGRALDRLSDALPRAERITLAGLGHSGPENDGDPRTVGETLREFFG